MVGVAVAESMEAVAPKSLGSERELSLNESLYPLGRVVT